MSAEWASGAQYSVLSTQYSSVDYLLVGHVCRDEGAWGRRLGGTVAYAALAAQACGCRVGVVTSAAPDLDLAGALPGVAVHRVEAPATTRFCNEYRELILQQRIRGPAAPL